jgi:hypothetical protein
MKLARGQRVVYYIVAFSAPFARPLKSEGPSDDEINAHFYIRPARLGRAWPCVPQKIVEGGYEVQLRGHGSEP